MSGKLEGATVERIRIQRRPLDGVLLLDKPPA